MNAPNLFLGIDGGGSKTTALLADADGQTIGRGVAGPSNYHVVGVEMAYAALDAAITAAFVDAALPPEPFAALCLGMAGVGRPEDRRVIQAWADAHYPGAVLRIANDAELVLAAGTPEGWGVAVIAGTGSLVYGRDLAGNTARAGGWGHLLGDEGSGYAIGLAALRAVVRAADDRGPATALTQTVLAHWALDAPRDLIRYIYRPAIGRTDIASLARVVIATVSQGDAVALGIAREAGRELAAAAGVVVRALGWTDPVPCALSGSVLVKGECVALAFQNSAGGLGLQFAPLAVVLEPAQGALSLALRAWAHRETFTRKPSAFRQDCG